MGYSICCVSSHFCLKNQAYGVELAAAILLGKWSFSYRMWSVYEVTTSISLIYALMGSLIALRFFLLTKIVNHLCLLMLKDIRLLKTFLSISLQLTRFLWHQRYVIKSRHQAPQLTDFMKHLRHGTKTIEIFKGTGINHSFLENHNQRAGCKLHCCMPS